MTRALRQLPGPRGLPLVGSLHEIVPDPLGFVTRIAAEHGGAAYFRVGRRQMLLLTEPALIEELLVQRRQETRKDEVTASLADLLGEGLLTSEGELWRSRRRLIAPSFQPAALQALGEQMVGITREHLARSPEGPIDAHAAMMSLTLDIAVQTLFGCDSRDLERVGPLVEEVMEAFNQRIHSWRRLLPPWVPTEGRRITARNRAELRGLLSALVARRRGQGGEDLLARLLAARDEAGQGLEEEALLDELLTLFIAGHETTALALGYALRLLGEQPQRLARAQAEVDRALSGRPPSAADLRQLPYVDAVFSESMRLYPPAWMIGRETLQPISLGDIEVPAGVSILLPQWAVHRSPRWWPRPLDFEPERWLEAAPERPRFAFFPFGGGPRVCVGNHFARMEAVLVLACWLQAMDLQAEGPPPTLLPSVTLRPRQGIGLIVRRRAS